MSEFDLPGTQHHPSGRIDPAVLVERRAGVMLITLNRPDAMNSINAALSDGVVSGIEQLNSDPSVRAGVLTGAGSGFCAGMDLKAFTRGENVDAIATFIREGSQKPLICAVEGFALAGGLELALACDLIVAAHGSKLGIPEVKVGLFAAGGGLLRLPERVGHGKAMEMAITGDPISAEEAAQFGLVTRLAPVGQTAAVALGIAERVARNAPLAVAASKQLIRESRGLTEAEFWHVQRDTFATVFSSNDAKEGPLAFAEKRAPQWTGT